MEASEGGFLLKDEEMYDFKNGQDKDNNTFVKDEGPSKWEVAGVILSYMEEFPFAKFYTAPGHYIGVLYVFLPALFGVVILLLYFKTANNRDQRKKRRIKAIVLLFLTFLVATDRFGQASLFLIPPVYSQTDDPGAYLVFGNYLRDYGGSVNMLFPAVMPLSAKVENTTKYYYYYQCVIDPSYDVYAEWVLPEAEYEKEKQRVLEQYQNVPGKTIQWGDWTCISFGNDELSDAAELVYYDYIIFAYDDQTCAVRYIASYSMGCGDDEDPYFLSLDW